MQNQSSEINETLVKASELFDGRCHQLSVEESRSIESAEVQKHLKNWALIGSALRDEMPKQIDMNFADKVMAAIENQEKAWVPPVESEEHFDQSELQLDKLDTKQVSPQAPSFSFKKLVPLALQTVVAASVAAVAVIGLQVYNASNVQMDDIATTASTNIGPVTGLNLASFQNNPTDAPVRLDTVSPKLDIHEDERETAAKLRKEELEKVNMYIQGYISETASR